MAYAKVENGEIVKYPYSRSDLRKENPNISFPSSVMDNPEARGRYGIVEVLQVSAPSQEAHVASEGTPEWNGSNWAENWVLAPLNYRDARRVEYGSVETQIEFIVEHSLDEWRTKVSEIKAKYPAD